MVVWGGLSGAYPQDVNTGGQYDPAQDTWTPTATLDAPSARIGFTSVWTGARILIWGGSRYSANSAFNTGGRYDPATNSWTSTTTVGAPTPRRGHVAVWSGREMLVWGGDHITGGRYVVNLASDDCDGDQFNSLNGDCDDTRASTYPGAPQICDGVDNDCSHPGWPILPPEETDADGDGFPLCAGDCSDSSPRVNPGAAEVCDDIDNDCDNVVDDGGNESCDDGNPCTDDVCTGATGCFHTNNTGPCDDGNACTVGDTCGNAACVGTPLDGIACDDGNACTTADVCATGICTGGPARICDDGNACNGVESCNAWSGCVAGTPPDCQSDNQCFAGACDPGIGCVFTPLTGPCDDHSPCTTNDTCSAGSCRGTRADGVHCDDGDPCTVDDTCFGYSCYGGSYRDCDDGKACTDDSCSWEAGGCVNRVNDANLCSDDNPCTHGDACRAGVCTSVPVTCTGGCPPGFISVGGSCQKTYDIGVNLLDNEARTCDGTGRNRYTCEGATYGFHWTDLGISLAAVTRVDVQFAAGFSCNSGVRVVDLNDEQFGTFEVFNTCLCAPPLQLISLTGFGPGAYVRSGQNTITIARGTCEGLSMSEALDDSFARVTVTYQPFSTCLSGTCDTGVGACDFTEIPDGSACTDFNACTSDDACSGGECVGGPLTDCNDGNICTNDACDTITGTCVHTVNFDPCDDGNVCTIGDSCGDGICQPFRPLQCSDNNPCTDDACDPATGCFFPNNTNPCNDDNACTSADACGGGACHGVAVVCNDNNACTIDTCNRTNGCVFTGNAGACDDDNPCTSDSCDPAIGCAHSSVASACNDGDVCTVGDACEDGVCRGTAVVCSDGNACTTDSCDPTTGCVFTNNTNACDDGNPCTADDRCGSAEAPFLDENFDGATPPALPAGWTSSVAANGTPWVTREASGEPTPNWAFGVDSDETADEILETPEIAITSPAARLTFRNRWSFDNADRCYDAGVLEIKIGAGSFADIVAAGGSFVSGGYTGSVATEYTNPLGGRDAWCRVSAGYPAFLTTAVNLPIAAAGQTIRLRWRIGSDSSVAAVGQEIDSIKVENSINICRGGPAPSCDDNNPCTDDSCDPSTGCVHTNNSNSCNDGNGCTLTDLCVNGTCVGSNPVVCPSADQCHAGGSCDPVTGACSNTPAPDGTACNDNSLCTTGETCRSGVCTPAFSGLNEPNPRTNGYYKSLCHGPHSGDALTDADAVCVASVAHTFTGISTVADLCAELEPSHPNSDACDRTDDDLMVLALNICRARVCVAQSIDSDCGGNANVGQSLAESDGILGSSSRTAGACAHAKCLDEEINTGDALELNSLTLTREKSGIRLRWSPPYLNDGTGHPSKYHVWRRALGSILPFRTIAESTETTFVDVSAGGETFQYEITAVMN